MADQETYVPTLFKPSESKYLFPQSARVAVDVALATHRPLLISGPPGCGKSTLAEATSDSLNWRYLKKVVTSRTQFEDLTGKFDTLRRLNDAQAARQGGELHPDWAYLDPGVLWWAFDPDSARWRGVDEQTFKRAGEKAERDVPVAVEAQGWIVKDRAADAVVLLDEIDKADPDVPNDLLEPLDLYAFTAIDRRVKAPEGRQVLVIITTNGERELPQAFLRRCVSLELQDPDHEKLVAIAELHYHAYKPVHQKYTAKQKRALYQTVASFVIGERQRMRARGLRAPSTAEYLDTVRACLELPIKPNGTFWDDLRQIVVTKQSEIPET